MRIPSSLSLSLALAGAFALAACSPPMGPEQPGDPLSTSGAPADSAPAPEPTEEADSPAGPSPKPTASPTAISADPGPETVPDMTGVPQEPDVISAFGGSPPSACVGGRVNLAGLGACMCQMAFPPVRNPNGSLSVRAGSSCGQPHYHRDLQLSLSGSLTPSKASVRSGEDIQVEATLKNLTSKRLPLVFATEVQDLGPEGLRPRLAVLDAAGKDVGAGGCISGGSASAGHLMVVIDPKGTAYYPIAWKVGALLGAQSGARCLFHTKALPPGKYTLSWRLPIEESQSLPASVVALKGAIEILP